MLARIHDGAASYRGSVELPLRLGVAVPLLNPRSDGLPDRDESAVLRAIEEALCEGLQPSAHGFLVAVITTNGMREFVFYVRTKEGADAAVRGAAGAAHRRKLQYYVKEDPAWDGYEKLAALASR